MAKNSDKKRVTGDLDCRNAKPAGEDYQMARGDGLSLLVRAKGTKTWVYQYRVNGRKGKLSLGHYPQTGWADAEKLHRVASRLVEDKHDPAPVFDMPGAVQMILAGAGMKELLEELKRLRAEKERAARMTFGEAASRYKAEWVDREWKSPDKGWTPARLHLLPVLESTALEDIETPMLRELFNDIRERKGVQAALGARGWAVRIFGFAVERGWCEYNPAQQTKAARIGSRGKRDRYLTTPEIRRYLTALYQADCYRGYKLALHLLLMLALRKCELCGANWSEIDLDAGEWRIPAGRMKGNKPHRVFLPPQAVEMLLELKRLGMGSNWVMPMPTHPGRAMNGNNLDGAHHAALTAGDIQDYRIHDHRHTASTHLREMGHLPEVVETALSHAIPGMAGTYSHAQYREQRLKMLCEWADFLDQVISERTVIQATFRKLA